MKTFLNVIRGEIIYERLGVKSSTSTVLFIYFSFFGRPRDLQDPSSPIRVQTHVISSESEKFQLLDCQGVPPFYLFIIIIIKKNIYLAAPVLVVHMGSSIFAAVCGI